MPTWRPWSGGVACGGTAAVDEPRVPEHEISRLGGHAHVLASLFLDKKIDLTLHLKSAGVYCHRQQEQQEQDLCLRLEDVKAFGLGGGKAASKLLLMVVALEERLKGGAMLRGRKEIDKALDAEGAILRASVPVEPVVAIPVEAAAGSWGVEVDGEAVAGG